MGYPAKADIEAAIRARQAANPRMTYREAFTAVYNEAMGIAAPSDIAAAHRHAVSNPALQLLNIEATERAERTGETFEQAFDHLLAERPDRLVGDADRHPRRAS